MKKNTGLYSNEHKKFLEHVLTNTDIKIDYIDENTINAINDYIKGLNVMSKDILEESIKLRVKDIELDISSYIAMTVGIISIDIAVIPILLKYISIPAIVIVAKAIEIIFAGISVYLAINIMLFYFKRKRELLFYKFVLNQIN